VLLPVIQKKKAADKHAKTPELDPLGFSFKAAMRHELTNS
jgi:hypothetical protein